ncbi:MAG: hypothetical protein M1825_001060 [Sarcosagium campestre]|nr:MAG: hypothetical protein M1825_001060 [Sarcosagium campestre]
MYPSRSASSPPAPLSAFKAKKTWPPDFEHLSHKHQFRLERKYKRRSQLKWTRPTWNKSVQLAQWGSIAFVLVYGTLFMDWGREHTPFQGIRDLYQEKVGGFWSSNASTRQHEKKVSRDDTSPVSDSA